MYSPIGIWSRFGGYADSIPNRDTFMGLFNDRMVLGGWTSRTLKPYTDFTITDGSTSASVFLSCPSTNDGNWAVFNNINGTRFYIIDQYVPDPPNKMACLTAPPSLGYIEVGGVSRNAVFEGFKIAVTALGFTYEQIGSFTLRVFYSSNTDSQKLTTGSAIPSSNTTNSAFTNGGYCWTSQISKRTVYKNGTFKAYGLENYFEIAMLQSSAGTPHPDLRVMAAKKFPKYPLDINPFSGANVTIDGATDFSGGVSSFRSNSTNSIVITSPWVMYVNPYTVLAYCDTEVSADHTYIEGLNLKLMDTRYADTQDLPFDELNFFTAAHSTGGGLGRGSVYNSYLRRAVKSNYGYNKVRYNSAGTKTIPFQGDAQVVSYFPGRSGAVTLDGPWYASYREGCEPWIGWGMTGETAGDLNIMGGQIWDAFTLHENTSDPVNSPLFFHDSKTFKRWTKSTDTSDNSRPFTLCVKVDAVI